MRSMTHKHAKRGLNNRTLDLSEIARRIKPVFTKHHIQRAILFGSFARGSQNQKSDIDLILIQETGEPYFERYRGILHNKGSGKCNKVFLLALLLQVPFHYFHLFGQSLVVLEEAFNLLHSQA